ncbi:uncharacterized protein MELLADRAFT_89910 [Melampsora larici-populina 98AG31]|uniref:Uncharacterized protein n=1 Tax=Melampsora larici-populina (strain 98AG31 / pathotype 3-4-7) TaxID=747676 RepID=F4RV29_MELLP|nr:uncharacterized protein MELLADRAFT_89910 [Melampsora larici-populina 98AG31]EGG03827.1 hypothetical protein MELLADRAFT_89910 [Melampsora larici-populina 98AG31]
MSGTGVSPPRGFHSWLAANGLTVTAKPVENQSTHGRNQNPLIGQLQAVTSKSASSTQATRTKPKNKTVGFCDLSNVDDDDPVLVQKNSSTSEKEKDKVECGEEGIDTNGLVALSKYFEDKMVALKGYLPLTIFNPQWLKQDLLQQSGRTRTTKEKLEESYVGMKVPVEWKMSFGEWVVAFDLFVAYLRYYKHDDVANRFVIHKENVMNIKKENFNWPMAFRYDIAIRTTVLTVRNANGKLANPAVRDEKIERNAFRDTERYNDFLPAYADLNPYSNNGPKAYFNPITGEDLRSTFNGQTGSNVHHSNPFLPNNNTPFPNAPSRPNARSWAYANQPVYDGPGGVSYGGWDDRRGSGRNVRGRGRSSGYTGGGQHGKDHSPPHCRFHDSSRRGEGSGGWRREERRDDRRNDEQDYNSHGKFRGNQKAK